MSERRACGLVGADRSTCRYHARRAAFGADQAQSAADLPTDEQRVAPKNRMGLC
ncbi:MAG TPA: hypothetical protein VGV06_07835 [Methylomirabilota bacterium]|nr:hypothetical protein [Methylomirabilota bacterium]